MTNFQQAANREQQLQQQRLLLGIPIGIGAVLAALVFGAAVVPQWLSLRANRERIDQIDDLEQRLPLLRDQLAKTSADQEQASGRRQQILALIQGSGEFNTFLAQLDREARTHRVQLDLFEPVVAPAPEQPAEAPASGEPGADAAPPKPPLEAAGLSKETVLLTAQGPYPNLLAFVRAVERLSLLVVPSDFAISLVERPTPPGAPEPAADAPKPTAPQLKLLLSYYTAPPGNAASTAPAEAAESGPAGDGQPAT
jgi:type IV pilus assembly protein PilO